MLDRDEFKEEVKFSIGERFNPLFSTPTFMKICCSFYDYTFFKKLKLDFDEVKKNFLEDLQEWEYLKSNFIPEKPKVNLESNRLRDMFLKDRELMRAQL